ncbi:MAG: CaiB/BaiF CoA transferase family protein [Candidatus Puniceispirillales bacterium WSBS_2018_MAG_OTU23]
MTSSSLGALNDIKVLDLSRILAGPSATQLLGDLGADVVKVERPGKGDDTRSWGPPYVKDADGADTTESGYFLSANRNKRSLAIDIKTDEGAVLVRKLVAKADVFIENFKLGGLKKYGLSYDDLKAINPRLIYCSITGFGQDGPNAHRGGYDIMAQGYGGIMSLTGPQDGAPYKVGVAIADVMTGMYAVVGVLAALRHRDKTGLGQHIDIALVDTQVSWLVNQGVNYLLNGEVPRSVGNAHPNIVPYQAFEASDGYIIIAVGNDSQFAAFAAILGISHLADDPRFATNQQRLEHRGVIIPLLAAAVKAYTRDDLLAKCESQGVPAGAVNSLEDVFNTDQVKARDMVVKMDYPHGGSGTIDLIGNPLKMSASPPDYRRPPPLCGEHNDEVIADWLDD